MVHSVSGWTRGVQVKLWDPLRMRAIPERLRGVFTTRRYTNPRLPLPLPLQSASTSNTFIFVLLTDFLFVSIHHLERLSQEWRKLKAEQVKEVGKTLITEWRPRWLGHVLQIWETRIPHQPICREFGRYRRRGRPTRNRLNLNSAVRVW